MGDARGGERLNRAILGVVALTTALASCAAPAADTAPPAAVAADHPGSNSTSAEQWPGRDVRGLPAGSQLWDIAVSDSGLFVAVGTDGRGDGATGLPLVIWRSDDGLSWREAFRRTDNLVDPGDASGLPSPSAVAAHPGGFAVVASTCPDRCRPFALYSADGNDWHEVEVPVRPPRRGEASAEPSGGGGTVSPVGAKRLIRATPDFTTEGAEVLDVVATGSRLVAVGWAEAGRFATAHAVWRSDDGGRTWRQVPDEAITRGDPYRDELDKVVLAGGRLVAGGGNRCCHGQAVGEVWVSDATGERWRGVPFPDGQLVTISVLAVMGDAVHILGGLGEERAQWRLSAEDRWERLAAPPLPGRLLAHPGGLMVVGSETTVTDQRRLALFDSPDGKQFRISRASGPRQGLDLEFALVVGDRLLAYATAGEGNDLRRLLFEATGGEGERGNGRAVWAVQVRPSPVLFGEGVRVPGDAHRFVDVTPSQKTPAELVVDAFFIGSTHGWALLADSETRSHRLLFTADGGAHWAAGGLGPSADAPRWLFFADRENGWITAGLAKSTYPPTSSLYRTTDGGRTWSGPSTIPGCGPVHFDTLLHGWLADPGYGDGCGNGLHETVDGGKTWTERKVARQKPGTPLIAGYGLPRLASRVLPVRLIEGGRSRAAFFVSGDEGETWNAAGSIEVPGGEHYPQASVADTDVWWAADSEGSVLAITTYGGKRWRQARPSGIRGRLVSLEAIDERRAWAVEANADGVRLMETEDGGGHWRPLLKE